METNATRRKMRLFFVEFGAAVLAFIVVQFLVKALVDFDTAGPWKYGAALLPLIPLAVAGLVVVRHARRIDEMQSEIVMRGMQMGFAFALAAAAAFGFLANAGLDLGRFGPWLIFIAAIFGWVLGSFREERRRA